MEKNSTPVLSNLVRLDVGAANSMRRKRRLLKGELARRAGVSAASVSRALNGKPIGLVTARAIAAGLRVRLRRLLADDAAGTARRLGAVLTGVIPERENWR
jgi:transcriptional regulator with XRE-family HTH domain